MTVETITVLDVGHGNCAVLEAAGRVVVIDAGPSSSILSYLEYRNITSIDTMLLSHADQDHVGGLLGILSSAVNVNKIRLNSDSTKKTKLWGDLLFELEGQDRKGEVDFGVSLTANMTEDFSCGDSKIEVLGPSKYLAAKGPGGKDEKGRNITTNSISAVVRVSKKEEGIILLAADLDQIALEDLQRETVDMTAKTLVFPHHGGRIKSSSFIPTLLQMVNPQRIIFSIGREKFRNPDVAVVEEITHLLPNVNIMCTQLSKNCATNVHEKSPNFLNSIYSQGVEKNRCCAGSIVIDLDSGEVSSPLEVHHANFVESVVGTPLCRHAIIPPVSG